MTLPPIDIKRLIRAVMHATGCVRVVAEDAVSSAILYYLEHDRQADNVTAYIRQGAIRIALKILRHEAYNIHDWTPPPVEPVTDDTTHILATFTPLERRVIELRLAGHTDEAIARMFGTHRTTVLRIRHNVQQKWRLEQCS
jgi:DNA-directed RNA polymerase specialized sigma24 family protein